ncbi:MAG: RIP metalloprotease RseP [Methylococcaceae bacterium]|nr:RIP metalloprotease RseP [Methylococcaceae bacterium]
MDILYTVFYFIVAIGLLVAIHEFGHFWVARRVGVKVIRFSIGFGKVIWSYQKNSDSTEYVLSVIPLGGYVKMVDEREGEVKEGDLPFAFNRQSLLARTAIVAAGPIFNLLLAVVLLWAVFTIGETGMRPIVGTIESGTLAEQAGFSEGEEILKVNDENAPTWSETMNLIFSLAMQGDEEIKVSVKNNDEIEQTHFIQLTKGDSESPEIFYEKLGLKPWSPTLRPIIGKIIENSAAKAAGLQTGDLIISANKEPMIDWMMWVEYVRSHPEKSIQLMVERDGGIRLPVVITPERVKNEEKDFGRIGAGVEVPKDLLDSLQVKYSLPVGEALMTAIEKTWFYSINTVKMMWKMLVGKASAENLSGPISIAQYAGQSAEMGLVPFFRFLAIVSISLGVLNLLPVPVLDGGHLMFFAIEAIKGSPISEKIQIYFQQVGMLMLMSLMFFAVFLDLGRIFQ